MGLSSRRPIIHYEIFTDGREVITSPVEDYCKLWCVGIGFFVISCITVWKYYM